MVRLPVAVDATKLGTLVRLGSRSLESEKLVLDGRKKNQTYHYTTCTRRRFNHVARPDWSRCPSYLKLHAAWPDWNRYLAI